MKIFLSIVFITIFLSQSIALSESELPTLEGSYRLKITLDEKLWNPHLQFIVNELLFFHFVMETNKMDHRVNHHYFYFDVNGDNLRDLIVEISFLSFGGYRNSPVAIFLNSPEGKFRLAFFKQIDDFYGVEESLVILKNNMLYHRWLLDPGDRFNCYFYKLDPKVNYYFPIKFADDTKVLEEFKNECTFIKILEE